MTNQKAPVSATLQGCSFQKWNSVKIVATVRYCGGGGFLIFENICTPFFLFTGSPGLGHVRPCQDSLECISGWLIRSRTSAPHQERLKFSLQSCGSVLSSVSRGVAQCRVQSPEAWHSPKAELSPVPVFYDNYKSPPLQGNYFCKEIKCSIQL